jgi:hypothetical protein
MRVSTSGCGYAHACIIIYVRLPGLLYSGFRRVWVLIIIISRGYEFHVHTRPCYYGGATSKICITSPPCVLQPPLQSIPDDDKCTKPIFSASPYVAYRVVSTQNLPVTCETPSVSLRWIRTKHFVIGTFLFKFFIFPSILIFSFQSRRRRRLHMLSVSDIYDTTIIRNS